MLNLNKNGQNVIQIVLLNIVLLGRYLNTTFLYLPIFSITIHSVITLLNAGYNH